MPDNKTVVITGATSGIGFAVCELLLKNGFSVIGIGHSAQNCETAKKGLLERVKGGDLTFFFGDLVQQQEVLKVAGQIKEHLDERCGGSLFALINNAGCVRSWYMTSNEGYEQQFALNHLAGFLLTYELLPNLKEGGGRVLFTSSGSHKLMKMRWNDIMFEKGYNPLLSYKQSKLCNMLTAYSLNKRYRNAGITAYGIDPGLVKTDIGNKNTAGIVNLFWKWRKRHGLEASESAKTYLMLCQEEAPRGLYYGSLKQKKCSGQVNANNADRLFALSEKLCNIRFLG